MNACAQLPALGQQVHSPIIERALCGAALVDGRALDLASPGHFFDRRLGALWQHMQALRRRGVPLDDATLLDDAPAGVDVELVADVAAAGGTSANVEHYAAEVRAHAAARRMLEAMADVDSLVRAGQIDGFAVISAARAAVERVERETMARVKPELLSVHAVLDDLERAASLPTMPLGWERLDGALGGGIVAGQVAILGGGTGAGKTAFAMQAAALRAERAPVIVASYELPPRLLLARVAAQRLDRSWLDIARGEVPRSELERVIPRGLLIAARPGLDTLRRYVLDIASREGEAPLIIVDYLQLVAQRHMAAADLPDIRIATAHVSEALRNLAAETDAPMLVISAVSRGGGTRLRTARDVPPADLVDVARECGSIEYDASAVIALSVADEEDQPGHQVATVTVAKSRFGRARHLDFRFQGAAGIWHEQGPIVSTRDEALREQIRDSLRTAAGPLSMRKIVERDGTKHVRGNTARVQSEIRAMAKAGELVEHNGAYALANPQ